MSLEEELNESDMTRIIFHILNHLGSKDSQEARKLGEDITLEYFALKQQYRERLGQIIDRHQEAYLKAITVINS